jgi:hypothetical protein
MITIAPLLVESADTATYTRLSGTLPVRPFHPDGFVGTLHADGQEVRVAALACDADQLVILSLVGFDASIGAVLARLWSSTAVPFMPASSWQEEWHGPEQLQRGPTRYKQCVAHLEGTREVHALAFLRTAHLTEGIVHPPDLPETTQTQQPADKATEARRGQTPPSQAAQTSKAPQWIPRYLLGNWDESGPHRQSFMGHLYALRVLFLHRHDAHPAWPEQWAEALWERGLAHDLITPIAALGLRAWKLSGDLLAWSDLVGTGVREGWLPWRE